MTKLNPPSPLISTLEIEPSIPLWKRVPTKDENGNYLHDFIMIIPKLNKQGQQYISKTINSLGEVLTFYEKTVVFADLNLKKNVLWVSIRATKGMTIEIPAAIKSVVPEAKLVGENPEILR
ncbi:MAG TPA: hypothetical protein ENI84_01350 [Thiothrix sp.]|nr:hypothetical protein [Thiothrix sp.]